MLLFSPLEAVLALGRLRLGVGILLARFTENGSPSTACTGRLQMPRRGYLHPAMATPTARD
jgi:hypothetical protein